MQLFFIHQDHAGDYYLDEAEARHCIKVLRYKLRDSLIGIDGKGNRLDCQIIGIHNKRVDLQLEQVHPQWGEKPQQISLAISPLRQRDRFEWAIEKAVELGVNHIYPIVCKRTVKTGVKQTRMQAIALAGMKQAKRSHWVQIADVQPISAYLEQEINGAKLVGWCETESPIQQHEHMIKTSDAVHLLIGPEGDFSEEEVNSARDKGFLPISLGENRLRTETAAIHSLGIIKYIQGW